MMRIVVAIIAGLMLCTTMVGCGDGEGESTTVREPPPQRTAPGGDLGAPETASGETGEEESTGDE